MSIVYRKTLKGINEAASNATGLPARLLSYLAAVDGYTPADVLAASKPHLASLEIILDGLLQQGFLEIVNAGQARNVVNMHFERVANGFSVAAPPPMRHAHQSPPSKGFVPVALPASPMLENYKANMVRDINQLMGEDAELVISKIQACRTINDLFAAMMGIKKIITIYADRATAEKFATKYQMLAS
jgi:hypothetical protein